MAVTIPRDADPTTADALASPAGAVPRRTLLALDALHRATPALNASPASKPPDELAGAPLTLRPTDLEPTVAQPIKRAQSLQYPFRCIGRVLRKSPGSSTWVGAGSGVLVGPWQMLTASHVLNGDPAGTIYKFVPAYFHGTRPNEITMRWYEAEIVGTVGVNVDSVSGYDYLVCELEHPLGLEWSWLGTQWSGSNGFYTNIVRTSVGYPEDLNDGDVPHGNLFTITNVKNAGHNSKEIEGQGDVNNGWSGGPLYGPALWTGDTVVGVLSGSAEGLGPHKPDNVSFAGGEEMVRLVLYGHAHWKQAERFNAVWAPGNDVWTAHYGLPRAYFDGLNTALLAKGYKLTRVNGYFLPTGELRLNGIWIKSTEAWTFVYGWGAEHFPAVYEQNRAQGYRLMDLNGVVAPNGQVLYNATWVKRIADWTSVNGWAREHLDGAISDLHAKGYRLEELNGFVLPDKSLRYNAIWVKSNRDQQWRIGWAREHFDGAHAEFEAQGYRLTRVNGFGTAGGGLLYNGIWVRDSQQRPQVRGWAFEHFAGTQDDYAKQGFQPIDLNAFVLV